jgi:hypothetical protein
VIGGESSVSRFPQTQNSSITFVNASQQIMAPIGGVFYLKEQKSIRSWQHNVERNRCLTGWHRG